ncbi:MAG: hypothetical protein HYX41_02915 [Bdellovibrio sp.]|nr:hypothetical protein [Bdellovibrio sp.]
MILNRGLTGWLSILFCGWALCLSFGNAAHALDDFRPLYRGARAQAMGNAFVAVADDEEAIFYNPAGLAGIKRISMNIASIDAQASGDLFTNLNSLTTALSSSSATSFNNIMGKNYFAQATGSAGLVAPGFGIAGIYDYWAAIRLQNQASPQGEFGAQNTYGGQIAFGARVLRFKNRRAELRVGGALKGLRRSGGMQFMNVNQIMNLSYNTITNSLKSSGIGIGVDLGAQLVYPFKKWRLQLGVALTDAGNTSFQGGSADVQRSNFTAGAAFIYEGPEMTATFAADWARILDYADWRKKTHLGMELKFPILSLYAGMSEFNVTFGAGLNLGLIRVIASSYDEELGTTLGQISERRYMIHAQFKFDL